MHRIFVHTAAVFALFCVSCSDAEHVGPDIARSAGPTTTVVSRTLPLHWIYHSDEWTVDVNTGAVESATPCGQPEPAIRWLGMEIDSFDVPDGSIVERVRTHLAPCASGRSAVPPDNRPTANLRNVDVRGNIRSASWAGSDVTGEIADYVTPHYFDAVFPAQYPFVVDRMGARLQWTFENEHGMDAVGGMRVTGIEIVLSLQAQ